MEYQSSIKIKNSSAEQKKLYLEPWAEEFKIGAGKTFEFLAKADYEGDFEVEFDKDAIIVWAWESSTVTVFCEGEKIGSEASGILKVPSFP